MKTIRTIYLFVSLLCACSLAAFAQGGVYSAETKALLSKMQAMGHGYHTDAEWTELFSRIESAENRAQADRDWDSVVEVNVIKAMVYSDMLNDQNKAISILQEIIRRYRQQAVPALRKAYVRSAEVYSKMGDEAAIGNLIKDYKASPLYDPQSYRYWGGQGRDVPLTIVRPGDRGDSSLSVTAMEMYRTRARSAAGASFPDFQTTQADGSALRLSDLRGKVVLVDFWLPTWEPWKRELPNLVELYRSYKAHGFEIVGFNLAGADSKDFQRAYRMSWPQATPDPALLRKLGVFGEATSFLLDQNGQVIGRNLKGAELTDAVKRLLGVP